MQALAFTEASAVRGALLTVAYCAGLGIPFIVLGLAFRRVAGALGWIRRHRRGVSVTGGAFLVGTGLLLLTGAWTAVVAYFQVLIIGFQPII